MISVHIIWEEFQLQSERGKMMLWGLGGGGPLRWGGEPVHACEGQRTTCGSWFCSALCVLGIRFDSQCPYPLSLLATPKCCILLEQIIQAAIATNNSSLSS